MNIAEIVVSLVPHGYTGALTTTVIHRLSTVVLVHWCSFIASGAWEITAQRYLADTSTPLRHKS